MNPANRGNHEVFADHTGRDCRIRGDRTPKLVAGGGRVGADSGPKPGEKESPRRRSGCESGDGDKPRDETWRRPVDFHCGLSARSLSILDEDSRGIRFRWRVASCQCRPA